MAATDAHTGMIRRDERQRDPDILDQTQQVPGVARDPPLVQHAAQHLHRPIEESTLFRCEHRGGECVQAGPVGPAAEQFALPPDRAGIERLLLRPGNLRKHPAEHLRDSPGGNAQRSLGVG